MDNSQIVLQQIKKLRSKIESYKKLTGLYDDAVTLAQLGIEEQDASIIAEAEKLSESFVAAYERFRIDMLLSGEYDANNAIVSLHSGAGGTESCDWVSMLFRMYGRWAEKSGFKVEIFDLLD